MQGRAVKVSLETPSWFEPYTLMVLSPSAFTRIPLFLCESLMIVTSFGSCSVVIDPYVAIPVIKN